MQRKFHIKKGDLVIINTGENKGKQGRVLEVLYDKEKAIVEGVNMISKHTKPNAKSPQGGITRKEAPVHLSNLNLIDPSTGKATRIGRKLNAKNKLTRYAKKSGEEIK
jgi:large subunit ribosomal protein L24